MLGPREVRRERVVAAPAAGSASRPIVAGVSISHPDRVVFPDPRLTKLDLARYCESIADWIVPHVEGRPLTLVRCPDGIVSGCHFMRHARVWGPSTLRRVRIQEKTKLGEYLIADDLAGIVGLMQMGVVEIHTWNSRFEDVERPNRLVIDLDPGERVGWPGVVRAARTIRKALEALDLQSFPKTTGGRGLHIVVPLAPEADWAACLSFARRLAERLEGSDRDTFTTDFARRGRADKILIDYLRNNRTNTSIAAFSVRARSGAPVSVPLRWNEVKPSLRPATFTASTVPPRFARLRDDPWRDYWTCRQKLTRQRQRAVELA